MQQGGPQTNQTEGLSGYIISRLTQGFSFRCLRFESDVAASHARFASGWRAAPLPGGSRTLWIASKGFRLHPSSFEPPPDWWTPLVSSERSGKVSNGSGTASFYG